MPPVLALPLPLPLELELELEPTDQSPITVLIPSPLHPHPQPHLHPHPDSSDTDPDPDPDNNNNSYSSALRSHCAGWALTVCICWTCGEVVARGEERVGFGWWFWHWGCLACLFCRVRTCYPSHRFTSWVVVLGWDGMGWDGGWVGGVGRVSGGRWGGKGRVGGGEGRGDEGGKKAEEGWGKWR